MTEPAPQSLAAIDLFRDVDGATIRELDRRCSWRHYAAGERIVDHMDDGRDVYFIVSGAAEVVVYSNSGRYISFDDLKPGSSFGTIAAIDGMPRSASVVAATDSVIGSMSPGVFTEAVAKHPDIGMNLMREMARIIRRSTDRIVELSSYAAPYRIQAELLRLSRLNMINDKTAMFSPPPSQTEIASRASTTRETVARVFGDLVHKGLIRRAPKTLYVNDVPRLAELVEGLRETSA